MSQLPSIVTLFFFFSSVISKYLFSLQINQDLVQSITLLLLLGRASVVPFQSLLSLACLFGGGTGTISRFSSMLMVRFISQQVHSITPLLCFISISDELDLRLLFYLFDRAI